MAVDTPSMQYDAMKTAGSWDLCLALLGGTPAMRKTKETNLNGLGGTRWRRSVPGPRRMSRD